MLPSVHEPVRALQREKEKSYVVRPLLLSGLAVETDILAYMNSNTSNLCFMK